MVLLSCGCMVARSTCWWPPPERRAPAGFQMRWGGAWLPADCLAERLPEGSSGSGSRGRSSALLSLLEEGGCTRVFPTVTP